MKTRFYLVTCHLSPVTHFSLDYTLALRRVKLLRQRVSHRIIVKARMPVLDSDALTRSGMHAISSPVRFIYFD